MIQKSSHHFSHSLRVSLLTFDTFVNCFIRVNVACFMKLWPWFLKWLYARIAFGLLTSFLLLFSLKLNGVSDFPMYWILLNMQKILLERGEKPEKRGGGWCRNVGRAGQGGYLLTTLQFNSITFTVCVGKVSFPLLLFGSSAEQWPSG